MYIHIYIYVCIHIYIYINVYVWFKRKHRSPRFRHLGQRPAAAGSFRSPRRRRAAGCQGTGADLAGAREEAWNLDRSPFVMCKSPFFMGKSAFVMGKSAFVMGKSPLFMGKSG